MNELNQDAVAPTFAERMDAKDSEHEKNVSEWLEKLSLKKRAKLAACGIDGAGTSRSDTGYRYPIWTDHLQSVFVAPDVQSKMQDAGFSDAQIAVAEKIFEGCHALQGFAFASVFLDLITASLPTSTKKLALRRSLRISVENTFEKDARLAGCSKQFLNEEQARMTGIIRGLRPQT